MAGIDGRVIAAIHATFAVLSQLLFDKLAVELYIFAQDTRLDSFMSFQFAWLLYRSRSMKYAISKFIQDDFLIINSLKVLSSLWARISHQFIITMGIPIARDEYLRFNLIWIEILYSNIIVV